MAHQLLDGDDVAGALEQARDVLILHGVSQHGSGDQSLFVNSPAEAKSVFARGWELSQGRFPLERDSVCGSVIKTTTTATAT
jgi:hypothetical protein